MRPWGQRAIAVALSIAFIADIPAPATAKTDAGAVLAVGAGLLLAGAIAGAAAAHASSAPRKVVVKKPAVSSRKCHTELLPVLNSKGKQIASQQKQVC